MIKTYGTSEEEDLILDNVKSREIVQTVLNYGVNQKQILQIIYLFSLELEDTNIMKNIVELVNNSRKESTSSTILGAKNE